MAKKTKKTTTDFNKKGKKPAKKKKQAPAATPSTYVPSGNGWCGTMAMARRNWGRRNGNGW